MTIMKQIFYWLAIIVFSIIWSTLLTRFIHWYAAKDRIRAHRKLASRYDEIEAQFKETFRLMGELFGRSSVISYARMASGKSTIHIDCRHCGQKNRLREGIDRAHCGACKKSLVLEDNEKMREGRMVPQESPDGERHLGLPGREQRPRLRAGTRGRLSTLRRIVAQVASAWSRHHASTRSQRVLQPPERHQAPLAA